MLFYNMYFKSSPQYLVLMAAQRGQQPLGRNGGTHYSCRSPRKWSFPSVTQNDWKPPNSNQFFPFKLAQLSWWGTGSVRGGRSCPSLAQLVWNGSNWFQVPPNPHLPPLPHRPTPHPPPPPPSFSGELGLKKGKTSSGSKE